ncbi:MAG: 50S ribosomal protein L29 [Eubacteriales bacterium]|jgi:large subunit ribosomal protein L29|nr:50S ribosomal protein L29 [Clostridiales bacterium]
MKASELRAMTSEELENKLAELKSELLNLRFQHAINQLENTHRIVDVKRDIARVMTVLHERNA